MARQLLYVTYRLEISRADFEKSLGGYAGEIAKVPGLRWKIWFGDEDEKLWGGAYLFEDEASARAYVDGPIITQLKGMPGVSDLTVEMREVMEGPTGVTRGPIGGEGR